MELLGVLSNPDYKITALMDHLAMITVQPENRSRNKIFHCKPLGVIWAQFPEVSILFISVLVLPI
jgi:ubiquitin-like domain-containing CTD phosphatase 1